MNLSMQNNFLHCKKLNILVTFDRILKDPDIFILQNISNKYYEQFKEYSDMESIMSLSTDTLEQQIYSRSTLNVLKWAATKEFDYEKNYNFLYNAFKEMYIFSKELKMVETLKLFLNSYCIERMLIYNEKDDIRQRYDLSLMFGDSNIEYIVGPMDEILKKIKIHIVYDWDARRIADLIDTGEFEDTFFGIAGYGFNFEDTDDEKKKDIFYVPKLKYNLYERENVAYFRTMQFTKKSFFKG